MYQFVIPNKKLKTYFLFALGIIILNLVGFAVKDFFNGKENSWIYFLGGLVIVLSNLFVFIPQKKYQVSGTIILIVAIFWLAFFQELKLFFINIILWALYTIARRKLIIKMDSYTIVYPTFPPKSISWSEVNNVILKDDILTIDLKNNKIYQHLIECPSKEVNEAEFNDFCRKQLMGHGS